MADRLIDQLVAYALEKQLIEPEDAMYARNRLLETMQLTSYTPATEPLGELPPLADILNGLLDDACARGVIVDSTGNRDLFDTKLMGVLTPRPSQVIARFRDDLRVSSEQATDRFYRFSQDNNYIRRDRIIKDMRWLAPTEYGDIDITINLSKPEKDPRDIAAAKLRPQAGYPACLLCVENEGYEGRIDHPARQNHRILPLTLCGEPWGFQYSPYVYYNEHCIVFNQAHVPMTIEPRTFRLLFSFVEQFPHYIIGSNADLPIVGGSILTHEHFQGGRYTFAMAKAPIERTFAVEGFEDVTAGVVKWPMSVIRLASPDHARICELAAVILAKWRVYSDASVGVLAESDGEPHNTITPIARKNGANYELDLVLRNNRTSAEHPMGIFHPHAELHHIKKENIGLIEVMGLAVLPSRLKNELRELNAAIRTEADLAANPATASHQSWAQALASKYAAKGTPLAAMAEDALAAVLRDEVGQVFCQVLTDAGVFKRNPEGQAAFDRFNASIA